MAMNTSPHLESTTETITNSDGTTKPALERQRGTNGAAHVASVGLAASQDYIQDLTMNGTAQAVAIPTGTKAVTIFNDGATTEDLRATFGTSQANAEANLTMTTDGAPERATTGFKIPPIADSEVHCLFKSRIPALATHVAVANGVDSDTQAVQIIFWS